MDISKRNTGPNALRRGRVTAPNADYFVTVCLLPRSEVFVSPIAAASVGEAQGLEADGSWMLHSLTVMPDHLHLFFTLGRRLTLSQVIARLKTKTQVMVRLYGYQWQNNFYDHHVRESDSVESIMRYIHLNPYRAGLVPSDKTWPYFYCREEVKQWFQGSADDRLPQPEWLQ